MGVTGYYVFDLGRVVVQGLGVFSGRAGAGLGLKDFVLYVDDSWWVQS